MAGKYGREGDGGGSSRTWQRDDKGRKYREEAGARVYERAEDRDDALEERYRRPCGQGCCRSMLEAVAAHQDELIAEYMNWSLQQRASDVRDSDLLHEWEVSRFGDRLYMAAHGLLLRSVRVWVEQGDKGADAERVSYERAAKEIKPVERYRAPKPAADDSQAEARREAGATWLGMGALLSEIAALAEGFHPRRKLGMPRRGRSNREWERMQNDAKMRAAGDDWRAEQ